MVVVTFVLPGGRRFGSRWAKTSGSISGTVVSVTSIGKSLMFETFVCFDSVDVLDDGDGEYVRRGRKSP